MASAENQTYDDRLLTRYFLGALSEDETERLDELSIADDEFASRLQVVENDLVDAYVRGELAGETLEQFRSVYLSSAKRREKVQFAEALFRATDLRPAVTHRKSPRTWLPEWALAAAASLLLFTSGFLLYQNLRLRGEMELAQAAIAALRQRAQTGAPSPPLEKSSPQARPVETVAIVLAPLTRGRSAVPVFSLGSEDRVSLQLELESSDFARYRAVLKDAATGGVLWRSNELEASVRGQSSAVFTSIPAGILKQQNYTIELTGISAGGAAEFAGAYAFRVVTK
jgi:hypothetical protein